MGPTTHPPTQDSRPKGTEFGQNNPPAPAAPLIWTPHSSITESTGKIGATLRGGSNFGLDSPPPSHSSDSQPPLWGGGSVGRLSQSLVRMCRLLGLHMDRLGRVRRQPVSRCVLVGWSACRSSGRPLMQKSPSNLKNPACNWQRSLSGAALTGAGGGSGGAAEVPAVRHGTIWTLSLPHPQILDTRRSVNGYPHGLGVAVGV